MDKNTFTRSNVNERTLAIQSIDRSSFDLSHSNSLSMPIGKLIPVNLTYCMPNDTVQGGINPQLQLDKIATPRIGRLRLDTHTFFVNQRRINRDFRKFVEQAADGRKTDRIWLPHFDPATLFQQFFGMLNKVVNYKDDELPLEINDFFQHYWLSCASDYSNFGNGVFQRLHDKIYEYIETKSQDDNSGFTLDILKEYADTLPLNQHVISFDWDFDSFDLCIDNAYRFFDYWYGVGSTMDYVKYPILHNHQALAVSLKRMVREYKFRRLDGTIEPFNQEVGLPAILRHIDNIGFAGFFKAGAVTGFNYDHDLDGSVSWDSISPIISYDTKSYDLREDPFRYVYACYYDHFREFHMERHDLVLNPDDWGSTPLLNIRSIGVTDAQQEQDFFTIIQLISLRQRYFSRDFLTTVQHDNVYRHVYAPIYQDAHGEVNVTMELSSEYDNITSIVNETLNTMFPKGLFSHQSLIDDTKQVLQQDLQTMRRTHMLESFLAHNYYNPDTFTGQIEGHWQIKPNDVGILQAQYLGGSESFITGDQQINNTTTEYMDAGTRTMVANATSDDSFSFAVGGEFGALVSFASLVPMVVYDCADMMARDLEVQDLPFPEFANDTRVQIKLNDMLRGFNTTNEILGYVPRYYGYRTQGDEVHGRFLTDWRSYNWLRDWANMPYNLTDDGQHGFRLSPYCMRVRVNTDAFIGIKPWQPICFGDVNVKMFMNRPLPAAVEIY